MSVPFSDEDLLPPVQNIVDTKISPMMARDGGAIELLGIKDSKIFVQLKGACVGCAASSSTLRFIVEKELRAAIHPELQIVNVPQGMEDKWQDL